MPDAERLRERLENIRTVRPVLEALRTISSGSWQAALRRRKTLSAYARRLQAVLPILLPHLDSPSRLGLLTRLLGKGDEEAPRSEVQNVVLLVVGSERGLCGAFNDVIVTRAERYLERWAVEGGTVELMLLGEHVRRYFERQERPISWFRPMTISGLPPFSLPLGLSQRWLTRYETGELDRVDLLYNVYQGVGRYASEVTSLIPPEMPDVEQQDIEMVSRTIVETDPRSLYARVLEQWVSLTFYAVLLESVAAEHSTRYQLLERASGNTERLVEELNGQLQAIRREKITREMQDLATGAGLLDDEST